MAQKRTSEKEIVVSPVAGTAAARRKTAAAPRARRTVKKEAPAGPERPTPVATEVIVAAAVTVSKPSHTEIAALAYSYWESRGYQGGCPEEDWQRAERELSARA